MNEKYDIKPYSATVRVDKKNIDDSTLEAIRHGIEKEKKRYKDKERGNELEMLALNLGPITKVLRAATELCETMVRVSSTKEGERVKGGVNLYPPTDRPGVTPIGGKLIMSKKVNNPELIDCYRLLAQIAFDFDPDKEFGPPCGPEMQIKIREIESKHEIDLRDFL